MLYLFHTDISLVNSKGITHLPYASKSLLHCFYTLIIIALSGKKQALSFIRKQTRQTAWTISPQKSNIIKNALSVPHGYFSCQFQRNHKETFPIPLQRIRIALRVRYAHIWYHLEEYAVHLL